MKRSILFVIYGLGIGGVEKCFINLSKYINSNKYDVTVAIMNPEYELLDDLSPSFKLIRFEDHFINTQNTVLRIKNSSGMSKIVLLLRYIIYRIAVKFDISPWLLQKPIPGKYDVAIAYGSVGYTPQFVLDKTRAKRKILWYHTTYIPKNVKVFSRFDQIIAVSNACRINLISHIREAQDKIRTIYNLYDYDKIIDLAKEDIKNNDIEIGNKISIVTVARLSKEKGFESAIRTCSQLKKRGLFFAWYWVGGGNQENNELANEMIDAYDVGDYFFILGNIKNPYPYITKCTVYVQPSEREAYCTTIIEAMVLNKYLVLTNIDSFHEQIENYSYKNVMFANDDNPSLADCIVKLTEQIDNIRDYFFDKELLLSKNMESIKEVEDIFDGR